MSTKMQMLPIRSRVMQSGMQFSPSDWAKLTKEKKSKIYEFNKKCWAVAHAPNSVMANSTNVVESKPIETLSTSYPASTNCDIRHFLSNSTSCDSATSQVVVHGCTYTLNFCSRTYKIINVICHDKGALIDSGANGGLSGSDVLVIAEPWSTADFTWIADKTISNLKICRVAALIEIQIGPIIGIFHQYSHRGTGKTIHSVSQIRQFGTLVDDTPQALGGLQRLQTLDGYIIPLFVWNGYFLLRTHLKILCPMPSLYLKSSCM
jgi:hypothetical protein